VVYNEQIIYRWSERSLMLLPVKLRAKVNKLVRNTVRLPFLSTSHPSEESVLMDSPIATFKLRDVGVNYLLHYNLTESFSRDITISITYVHPEDVLKFFRMSSEIINIIHSAFLLIFVTLC
jgi:hypothetical protein